MWDNERTDLQARKTPDEKTLAIVWVPGEIGLRFRRTEAEDMSRGGQNRTHGTVEYCDRLDSFRDAAQSGRYTAAWSSGNAIVLTVGEDAVWLAYQAGRGAVSEQVALSKLPNHYGGARPFFLCPGCGRRVRFLYLRWERFRCRHCARLNYLSQQTAHDEFQPYRQAVKLLRQRFGLEDVPCPMDLPHFEPERPHRMREATFFRLKCRLWRLTDQYRHRFITRAKAFLRLK